MQSASPRYWEDYQVGTKYRLGSTSFTDAVAASESMFGGLIASGWHINAKLMRLFVDNYLDRRTALGSPGLDEIRWLKPVRPGDTLTAWVECAGKVPSRSRPDMGVIHEHWGATNQKGELAVTVKGINMVRRRPA
jgi:acyl dehydratase